MKIIDILKGGWLSLSFEIFPPKTESAFDSVKTATEEIARLGLPLCGGACAEDERAVPTFASAAPAIPRCTPRARTERGTLLAFGRVWRPGAIFSPLRCFLTTTCFINFSIAHGRRASRCLLFPASCLLSAPTRRRGPSSCQAPLCPGASAVS